MARVLARAVRDRQRPLRRDVEVGFGGVVLRLTATESEHIVALARRRDPAAAVGHDLGVQHQSQGRVVAGRVGVRQHAADGAHVADLVVTDLAGDLGQHGQVLLDLG